MPISRKKACARCRAAKARCNLKLPHCSRCAERGLRCEYDKHGSATPYPGSTDIDAIRIPAGTPDSTQIPDFNDALDPGPGRASQQLVPLLHSPGDLSTLNWADIDVANMRADCLLAPNPPLQMDNSRFDVVSSSDSMDTCNQALEITTSRDNIWNDHFRGSNSGLRTELITKRSITTAQELFTTRMMLGQVESYPKMLIEGLTLPPFIHSRCTLDEERMYECSQKRMHQCLPQILSICASLVHLFYTKTPASTEFVWKTIYAEQTRLHREVCDIILSELPNTCSMKRMTASISSKLYRLHAFTFFSKLKTPSQCRRTTPEFS